MSLHDISAKVEAGERIDAAEAATLWRHAPDEELQRLAGLVRARYHEADRATYIVMRPPPSIRAVISGRLTASTYP